MKPTKKINHLEHNCTKLGCFKKKEIFNKELKKAKKAITKTLKEKVYEFNVDIPFTQRIHATNKKDAIKQLKESFLQDYNLEITEEEYTLIK